MIEETHLSLTEAKVFAGKYFLLGFFLGGIFFGSIVAANYEEKIRAADTQFKLIVNSSSFRM